MKDHSVWRRVLNRVAGEIWCVPSVRAQLGGGVDEQGKAIVGLLIKVRLLSFAFVTSPVLSLIPFVLTNNKGWGLVSFAVGTLSIIIWLIIFDKLRTTDAPSNLIRKGAIATILLSALLGLVLLSGALFNVQTNNLVIVYLLLQFFTGIPFALINGIDSKLSGSLFRTIRLQDQIGMSPNAEFRRCKSAGSTAATALGALVWCTVILFNHAAITGAGWYSILFALNILPALLLLRYLRILNKRLETRPIQKHQDSIPARAEEENHSSEMTESIVAIGCLDGLLQFSQFYFSISAIKALFDNVPNHSLLFIAIPLMFYIVNGIEQGGALLFSRYHARSQKAAPEKRAESIKRRQYVALLTLLIAACFFVLHVVVWHSVGWSGLLDVVAYGLFNIVKGFAGGLSEEWNESIVRHYPQHDEARFATYSALFGRLYQIASIACFFFLIQFVSSTSWIDIRLTELQRGAPETAAFVGTLTVFIFVLFGANILGYFWIGQDTRPHDPIWRILQRAILQREKRTALFTQLLRVLFVVSLILANLLSLKVVNYKGLIFAHGSVFYIMLFVLINLITVFEDVEAAIKTVFLGMISYVVVFISLLLSAKAGGYLLNVPLLSTQDYNTLLGHNIAGLYFASACGYAITVVLDVWLLTLLSKHFATKSPVILGAVVTFICQVIDTLIFIRLGYDVKEDLISMLIGQFSVKFSVYLVMYFPLYYLIQACKQWIGLERRPAEQG